MEMMNRAELKTALQNDIVTVRFEKADGSLREMRCTLQASYLPEQVAEEKKVRAENDTVLAVWDLDNGGWRSFRMESIKNIVVG
jgi:hypothetical protein